MSNATRVRVEARRLRNDSPQEKERNFKILFQEFKRRVSDAGILAQAKDHQNFESKGEKRRKKKREAILKHKQEMILDALQRGETPKGSLGFGRKKKKKKNRSQNSSD